MEKRIQEDHLQQLALFSEYGRMALNKEQELATGSTEKDDVVKDDESPGQGGGSESSPHGASSVGFAAQAKADADALAWRATEGTGGGGAEGAARGEGGVEADGEVAVAESKDRGERPFQRLEFLVRDWQVRHDRKTRSGNCWCILLFFCEFNVPQFYVASMAHRRQRGITPFARRLLLVEA